MKLLERLEEKIDKYVRDKVEERAVKWLLNVIRYDDRVTRIDVTIRRDGADDTVLHMVKEVDEAENYAGSARSDRR